MKVTEYQKVSLFNFRRKRGCEIMLFIIYYFFHNLETVSQLRFF